MSRDFVVWGCAGALMAAALLTVHLRREIYVLGREIGSLDDRLVELRRRNDNLLLGVQAERSPRELRRRAEESGLLTVAGETGR